MYVRTVFAIALLCLFTPTLGGTVSTAQETLAVNDVEAIMSNDIATTAEMVRLAFHDAVGVSPNHKSDGCINLNNADNRGLISIVGTLDELYDRRQADLSYGQMSRADFWALAGATAARVAALRSTCDGQGVSNNAACIPPMPLVYGRVDCATSPTTTSIGSFPNAQGGMATVMDLFRDEMGLSTKEVVAVMGAHALGDANPNDSGGFRGPWVPQGRAMILDNAFYVELAAKAWAQDAKAVPGAPAGTVVHQWDASNAPAPGQIMMLNTDAALYKQVAPDANGVSACATNINTCPNAVTNGTSTTDIVVSYSNNNAMWAQDFGAAFSKLYSTGYSISNLASAGQEVPNTVSPTTPSDSSSSPLPLLKSLSLLPFIVLFVTLLV